MQTKKVVGLWGSYAIACACTLATGLVVSSASQKPGVQRQVAKRTHVETLKETQAAEVSVAHQCAQRQLEALWGHLVHKTLHIFVPLLVQCPASEYAQITSEAIAMARQLVFDPAQSTKKRQQQVRFILKQSMYHALNTSSACACLSEDSKKWDLEALARSAADLKSALDDATSPPPKEVADTRQQQALWCFCLGNMPWCLHREFYEQAISHACELGNIAFSPMLAPKEQHRKYDETAIAKVLMQVRWETLDQAMQTKSANLKISIDAGGQTQDADASDDVSFDAPISAVEAFNEDLQRDADVEGLLCETIQALCPGAAECKTHDVIDADKLSFPQKHLAQQYERLDAVCRFLNSDSPGVNPFPHKELLQRLCKTRDEIHADLPAGYRFQEQYAMTMP